MRRSQSNTGAGMCLILRSSVKTLSIYLHHPLVWALPFLITSLRRLIRVASFTRNGFNGVPYWMVSDMVFLFWVFSPNPCCRSMTTPIILYKKKYNYFYAVLEFRKCFTVFSNSILLESLINFRVSKNRHRENAFEVHTYKFLEGKLLE